MFSSVSLRRFSSLGLAAGLTTAAVTSAAFADVKQVQTLTTTSTGPQRPGGNSTTTTTAYFKGNKVRQENPTSIVLMDGDTKQIYNINKAQKTYTVAPLGEMPNVPGMDMMQFNSKTTITPTGRTKTVAGKVAKGYTFNSVITMSMNAKGQQMMQGQGAPKNLASMLPTIRITGEMWAAESIQVAPVGSQAALSMLRSVPGMRDFAAKITSVKGLPLENTTNVSIQGGMMNAQTGGKGIKTSTKLTTTQLSQAPLPASLFVVPAGYQKVAAPAPGRGGMRQPMAP